MNSALICFGLATITLSGPTVAKSNIDASSAVHAHKIPAGSLEVGLDRFVTQEGIKLSYKNVEIKGKETSGLNGNYTTQDGLNRLLASSNLQAVLKDNVYVVQKSGTPKSSTNEIINLAAAPGSNNDVTESMATLPIVKVSAKQKESYAITNTTTATKTNTLLRDVPQSISVVTKAAIQDQALLSISDTVRYVPGVGISNGEGNRDAIVFRGNRSTADFFVDGVRDDVQYFRDLYNIERVEVLKGPNGMIFGRGGSGGVINRVAKEAGWDPVREFTAQVGSYGTKRVALDVGQGINDVAAFRLNTMYENSDSFRDGVDLKRFGINPTVTVMPTIDTKIVLSAEYVEDDRTADRGIPSVDGRPISTKRSTFFGDPDRSGADSELKAFNAMVEHKFNDDVKIRNRTRYATQDKFYQNVYANSSLQGTDVGIGAYNNLTNRDSFFNQTDFLFSLDTGGVKHDMVAGLEFGRQDTDSLRQTGIFSNTGTTSILVPVNNPITKEPLTFTTKATDADINSVTKQTSLYLQDQITLIPQLQAVLGVRYDKYTTDFHSNNLAPPDNNKHTNDNFFAPRVGLIYKPIEEVSIYSSYSTSYVPRAGEQLTSLSSVNSETLKPEKFKNIEVGAKWDIRPDLALTTALFRLDRTNVILPDPNDATRTFLGGGQRNEGFELGLAGNITPAWSIMGGYTYQDGKITNTQSDSAKAGAVLRELPKHTFSLWNRYNIDPTWGVGLGVVNRSSMYTSTDNTVRLPGFARVDAAVYAKINKNLRAQLNIENLFDTHYFASAHNNNNISPGSPIAARVSLIANF
ncbi:TonB-dependent siderophore receptor [Candidatus Nitrotoga sp. M5]|uniref:TonB-dependent siderophore receptor n=1 Tax=Candidatus Nitrotoga sp. M5 TaxID=2890409 RepID=UPI001EF3F893|nr:TonB-dependent siderophore receptor [Candidatus Nitrotoga sp. M5]